MPEISTDKLKMEILDGLGTKQLINEPDSFHCFVDFLSEVVVNSWSSLGLLTEIL